jgi:hypothetical protein
MNRKIQILIVFQCVIIVILVWMLVLAGRDEFDSRFRAPPAQAAPAHTEVEDGAPVVRLSRKAQEKSGIRTVELDQTEFRPGTRTYGTIISIDALLDQRGRYLGARAQVDVARAAVENSRREAERLRQLNQDDRNVSDRVAEAAEAQARGDAARLSAAETQATALRDSLRLQWSEPLAGWAVEPLPPEGLQKLMDRREVLISVALPDSLPAPVRESVIDLVPPGGGKPLRAIYVGPAPQTDAILSGRSFFFRSPAAELRTGMRIAVRQRSGEGARAGVIVPAAAVVWYAGKAWVYEQEDDAPEEFVRRPIPTSNETENGWFVADVFEAGDRVVISGAQLLLSEEFKHLITNENDD